MHVHWPVVAISDPAILHRPPFSREKDVAAPRWLQQPPQRSGWVYAVGTAPEEAREQALAAARRELVNQLSVSIQAVRNQDDRGYEHTNRRGETTGSFDKTVRQQIRTVATLRDLPDVQVEAEYTQSGFHYVLVGFDRAQWARQLLTALEGVDAQLSAPPTFEAGAHPVVKLARHNQWAAPLLSEKEQSICADIGLRLQRPRHRRHP